jgi:hypothetical protein
VGTIRPLDADQTLVHVHVCGLPFMRLPLDQPGTCRYNWIDEESMNSLLMCKDRLGADGSGKHGEG